MGSSTGNPFGWFVLPQEEVSPTARAIVDALRKEHPSSLPAASPLFAPFGLAAAENPYAPTGLAAGRKTFLGSIDPSPQPEFGSGLGGILGSADVSAGGLGSARSIWPNLPTPAAPLYAPPKPKPVAPETKRRVFFSFQYDGDIMRTNGVRNNWKISHPDSAANRGFLDSSLWEERKLTSPEAIKKLITAGVLYTSAVCVLAGSMTWDRRWVRYEIARAVLDGRGLLTVHLNNIKHHRTKGVHPLGRNPLAHMGVAKLQPDPRLAPRYELYEMNFALDDNGNQVENWTPYSDYNGAVKKPAWLSDPAIGYIRPLSADTAEYDYVLDVGHRNIGHWIDLAAKQAGR